MKRRQLADEYEAVSIVELADVLWAKAANRKAYAGLKRLTAEEPLNIPTDSAVPEKVH
jgi:hypothetical protein